jgi:hypothetical protein
MVLFYTTYNVKNIVIYFVQCIQFWGISYVVWRTRYLWKKNTIQYINTFIPNGTESYVMG